jgi:hypothetical protein
MTTEDQVRRLQTDNARLRLELEGARQVLAWHRTHKIRREWWRWTA